MEGVCSSNAAMQHAGRTGQDRPGPGNQSQGRRAREEEDQVQQATPRPGLRHKAGLHRVRYGES